MRMHVLWILCVIKKQRNIYKGMCLCDIRENLHNTDDSIVFHNREQELRFQTVLLQIEILY